MLFCVYDSLAWTVPPMIPDRVGGARSLVATIIKAKSILKRNAFWCFGIFGFKGAFSV
ncbi:hypothetical protein SAMN04487996_114227 [Dyadobacter soli]|uniref:Uncharacterized protein n=1 Tax=Dyadobacter soli TaxID=659014 RepID=A0A1G7R2M9_9BACT|nr:hypothetical protein SAMN04487996_114227 [Dyadobacter soli]